MTQLQFKPASGKMFGGYTVSLRDTHVGFVHRDSTNRMKTWVAFSVAGFELMNGFSTRAAAGRYLMGAE